jgi:glycosyltransferase involved in cell wall biosynthesis
LQSRFKQVDHYICGLPDDKIFHSYDSPKIMVRVVAHRPIGLKYQTDCLLSNEVNITLNEKKKKIRLIHIVDNLDRGGVQTWLMLLVKGLAELGFEQRIYCLNEILKPDIVNNLETYGANVIVVGRLRLLTLVGLFYLYRDMRAWQPDITQTILQFSNVIGRPMARLLGVPVVISLIQARNIHVSKLLLFVDSLTARWTDLFVAVSRQAIPFAVAHESAPPDKVVYIPNSIEPDDHDRAPARAAIRAGLGISPEIKVLGMISRLVPKKAHQDLLQAYAEVIQVYPDTILLLAGDGPLRKKLARQASQLNIDNQVVFLGDRTDVPDLLATMDLFVHPTLSEGMPYAVLEAMAAGLPVIASAVDGVQDLIVDGESGWLVKPAHPQKLAKRIIFALENQTLWPQIGQAAAHRIAVEFSSQKMIMAYSAVYRTLLAGK